MRLATEVWVTALIRRAAVEGAFAGVTRRGDAGAGAVLVKTVDLRARTVRMFSEALDRHGERIWIEPHPAQGELELDAWAQRQAGYDPDLWIIEIEDARGRHFLTEPVVEGATEA